MAALRAAAGRLWWPGAGGVAVEDAQRRLFPRLSQVDRATRSTTSSAAAAGKRSEDREKLLTEIHNMREELYDKVSHAERIYNIPGKERKNFSRLREELATQVDPRPGDTTCAYVLMGMAAGKIVELEPDDKQWVKKKRGEARKRKQSETK